MPSRVALPPALLSAEWGARALAMAGALGPWATVAHLTVHGYDGLGWTLALALVAAGGISLHGARAGRAKWHTVVQVGLLAVRLSMLALAWGAVLIAFHWQEPAFALLGAGGWGAAARSATALDVRWGLCLVTVASAAEAVLMAAVWRAAVRAGSASQDLLVIAPDVADRSFRGWR